MPLYEYECDANGHRFEMIRKFSDPPIAECPQCGSPVHKLFSSPAIQFKGSGFYITDYPKKDSGAETSGGPKDKDSGGTDKEKSDTPAKSDNTPAASAATASDTAPKPATKATKTES